MNVVVLVPRRPEPWRDKLWRYVHRRLAEEAKDVGDLPFPIFEGLSKDGPFNRSAAVNCAAAEAGDWDVAVVLDADSFVNPMRIGMAAESAARMERLVFPHTEFHSLDRDSTRQLLHSKIDLEEAQPRWVTPKTKSSCLCIGHDLWEKVGGFDERFEGWGFEDAAFFAACQAISGKGAYRHSGPVHHLWHPRSAEKNPDLPEYKANLALADRYKAARKDANVMRAILAEPGGPLT